MVWETTTKGITDRVDLRTPPNMRTPIGFEDALIAGICLHALSHDPIDWSRCISEISEVVNPVLMVRGATPDSDIVISDEEEKRGAFLCGIFMMLAVILVGIGLFASSPPVWLFAASFLGTPVVAGACGGVLRLILREKSSFDVGESVGEGMVLGMIAGFISALLFVAAQWATNSNLSNLGQAIDAGLGRLIPFSLIIGFIGGFTLEEVYGKLKKFDPLRSSHESLGLNK